LSKNGYGFTSRFPTIAYHGVTRQGLPPPPLVIEP